jgi:hypothetical protein
MADREMIAATLAAGILSAADFSNNPGADPAEYAVALYRKVLAALANPEVPNRKPERTAEDVAADLLKNGRQQPSLT